MLESRKGDVMVVGGGISGIQASLDLADMGFRVFLVEKGASLGGRMAQLDKTFPTNDCSICIESPKFLEVDRHPNIEIISFAEPEKVEGEAGDFKVTLVKRPRYVDEDKCRACTTCNVVCPIQAPDLFNEDLSNTAAAQMFFDQAVPLISYIDPEACIFLKEGKCNICLDSCEGNAIDFSQKPEKIELEVGAVILSPGYEPFDPEPRGDFGYGKIRNVVTALEYERIICATGPYEGELRRPSDVKHPKKIAWIQCVGSRQVRPGGYSYCSSVCCTYTQKQVILAKDHDPEIEATIFHNDIRSWGKDFERFYQRAEELPGVRFIRSYVSLGREIPETGNVSLKYSMDGEVKEEEFEMVVLSIGLTPPKDAEKLANIFGLELTPCGFCKTNPVNPNGTSNPGIFVSGAFNGPMDIPEAVYAASGAAAQCGELLVKRRGKLARERIYPPERDVSGQEPRVGVFVCHCGTNIASVVNDTAVVEYASTLDNVVYAEENPFSCSTESAKSIAEKIKEKELNRVVVAACTPRSYDPVFMDTVREGGLNPYLVTMANIREHCSWVHSREKEKATQKAKDLVRMAVAQARHLEPLKTYVISVDSRALVIGGGVAGMVSALSLANQGFEVYLLEKDKELGGMSRRIHFTLEGLDVQAYLRELISKVYEHPLVHVFHEATILETSGYVGNYITKVNSEGTVREIRHGAVIVATGAEEYKPTEYLYGKDDRVMTLLELEDKIVNKDESVINSQSLVMIQCVGCRNKDRDYCSRVCCNQAIKNALKLKEVNPEMDIYILYRDMRTYGLAEDYYREAANREVKFIRYEQDDPPQVETVEEGGKSILRVTVTDPVLGQKIAIDADSLALAAAVVPDSEGNQKLVQSYRLSLNPDGFFLEAHVKLRPVDFATDGVFLCGMAHYPKHITETITQAYGAAGRAACLLSHDTITSSGSVCAVDEKKCIGCGNCIAVCNYGAIELHDTPQGKKATVHPVLCKGCGLCNAVCPTGAISLKHFDDVEIFSQIDEAFAQPVEALAGVK